MAWNDFGNLSTKKSVKHWWIKSLHIVSLPVDLAIVILIKIIPVHCLTVGLHQSRWPARKERSFTLQLPLDAMPTEANTYHQYTLENQSYPTASKNAPQTSLDSITETIRRLGWHQSFLKSKHHFSNATAAWCCIIVMTKTNIVNRYIKDFDMRMRIQKWHICLSLDNFSGHFICYEPQNIQLLYFKPNMTLFIQPLDAGIIRCFKAYYQWQFCLCTIEKDELGECNIYKINLLEGMLMAREAWKHVDDATIWHCWNHTKIQGSVSKSNNNLYQVLI